MENNLPEYCRSVYLEILSGGKRSGLTGRRLRRWAFKQFRKTKEFKQAKQELKNEKQN